MIQLQVSNTKLYANSVKSVAGITIPGPPLEVTEIHIALDYKYECLMQLLKPTNCIWMKESPYGGYDKCTVAMVVHGPLEPKHYKHFGKELSWLCKERYIMNRFLCPISKVKMPGEKESWLLVAYPMTAYNTVFLKTKSKMICNDKELGYHYEDENH